MNFFSKREPPRPGKRIKPVVFVLDVSAGDWEVHIKNALQTVMELFAEFNRDEAHRACVKAAVLTCSRGWKWSACDLLLPNEINVSRLRCASRHRLDAALKAVERKFSRNSFFAGTCPGEDSIIYFVSDGAPTADCSNMLETLEKNIRYVTAKKVVIGLGKSVDVGVLRQLAEARGEVYQITSAEVLNHILAENCTAILRAQAERTVHPSVTAMRVRDLCWGSVQPPNMSMQSAPNYAGLRPASSVRASENTARDVNCTMTLPNARRAEIEHTGALPDLSNPAVAVYCSMCGAVAEADSLFCRRCGTPVSKARKPSVSVSQVQFSAVVPGAFIKGSYAMIDLCMYEALYREVVERMIDNANGKAREITGSTQTVKENAKVTVRLSSPDLDLADCEETQAWRGKYLVFNFPVEIPDDYAKKQILFIASVYFDDVIATRLKFVAKCTTEREQKLELIREDVLSAFVSYASQDRGSVATIIQGMKKARPEMDIFFDVESLRSGENWEDALRREIENRDILYLCWSNYARSSEWVEKEWRYALTTKGLEAIEPIPLVLPTQCPPPEELKSKHFNDRALLYRML